MYADSWSDRSRKSSTLPIFQPLASRRFRFAARIVVILQSLLANSNDLVRRLLRLLGKDSQDQDGIGINAIHQPPRSALVIDPYHDTERQSLASAATGVWPTSHPAAAASVENRSRFQLPVKTAES